jgi:hypothetical protein
MSDANYKSVEIKNVEFTQIIHPTSDIEFETKELITCDLGIQKLDLDLKGVGPFKVFKS